MTSIKNTIANVKDENSLKRFELIVELYKGGKTIQEITNRFIMSESYVRQILVQKGFDLFRKQEHIHQTRPEKEAPKQKIKKPFIVNTLVFQKQVFRKLFEVNGHDRNDFEHKISLMYTSLQEEYKAVEITPLLVSFVNNKGLFAVNEVVTEAFNKTPII